TFYLGFLLNVVFLSLAPISFPLAFLLYLVLVILPFILAIFVIRKFPKRQGDIENNDDVATKW
ncbi:MAG: hypothetical protein ACFE7R_07080, partial [Candidatus Hodarchaeota archaeon]